MFLEEHHMPWNRHTVSWSLFSCGYGIITCGLMWCIYLYTTQLLQWPQDKVCTSLPMTIVGFENEYIRIYRYQTTNRCFKSNIVSNAYWNKTESNILKAVISWLVINLRGLDLIQYIPRIMHMLCYVLLQQPILPVSLRIISLLLSHHTNTIVPVRQP